MGKRTQTLDRRRLEKSVMDRRIKSLSCLDHTEEHLWDAEGEKMLEECLTPFVKHGAGKVGDLYKVKGILNKEGYHFILQRHAIPCGQRLIGANFLLQQDNDPKHTSTLCKSYLGKKQAAGMLSVMEWPAQSPDLNPIELLLEQLDCMVRKKCPSSQSNLWELLQEAWGEISTDYLNKLTARMPKVCNAVIAVNGAFFDESKVWRTKWIFQIKIYATLRREAIVSASSLFSPLAASVSRQETHWKMSCMCDHGAESQDDRRGEMRVRCKQPSAVTLGISVARHFGGASASGVNSQSTQQSSLKEPIGDGGFFDTAPRC